MKKLEDYLKYEQPTKYIVKNEKYNDQYEIPVLTAGKTFILGYTNETENIFPIDKLPVIIFDDFTTDCKYVDFPFKVKSSAIKILHPINKANAKFLYYYMKNISFDNKLHKRYWISEYSKLEINELEESKQNEFVEKMEKIEQVINIKKEQIIKCDNLIKSQFVEMFGNDNTKKLNLKSIANIGSSKRIYANEYRESGIPFYRSKEIRELGTGLKPSIELFIDEEKYDFIRNKYGIPKKGDILLAAIGATIGYMWIVDDSKFYYKDGNLINVSPLNDINSIYLRYVLEKIISDYKTKNASGSAQLAMTIEKIEKFEIPVPSIELQNKFAQIVEQIDKQKFELEKSLKKLEEMQSALMQKYFG